MKAREAKYADFDASMTKWDRKQLFKDLEIRIEKGNAENGV